MPQHPGLSAINAKTGKTGGRPRIRKFWIEEIANLMYVEEITSPTEIWKHLEAKAIQNGLSDLPSERTVNRYIKHFRIDTSDLISGSFWWPDSMGEKEHQVPWVASRDSLDLLRWHLDRNYRRPRVRVVKWYWRVCLASESRQVKGSLRSGPLLVSGIDDETIHRRLRLATQLTLEEIMSHQKLRQPSHYRSIELELAYQPERSGEYKKAYETALQSLKSHGPQADCWGHHDNQPLGL